MKINIKPEKIELLKLILEIEDEAVIQKIKDIFKRQDSNFWDDLPIAVKESVNRGLEDVAAGRVHKHEDVMRVIKTKFGINS